MDIPAPLESPTDADTESTKINVATVAGSDVKTEPKVEVQPGPIETPNSQSGVGGQKEIVDKDDVARKKIVELVSSKQYHLSIKEKRSSPLLIVGWSSKKPKKAKKKSNKKSEATVKAKPGKNKSLIQVVVLVALLFGFVLAIDAGLLSIGVTLPFDFIK